MKGKRFKSEQIIGIKIGTATIKFLDDKKTDSLRARYAYLGLYPFSYSSPSYCNHFFPMLKYLNEPRDFVAKKENMILKSAGLLRFSVYNEPALEIVLNKERKDEQR